jgi:hypothetical protein
MTSTSSSRRWRRTESYSHETALVGGDNAGLSGTVREVERLPGEELVRTGVRDLERGTESLEALLVSIGAPRLAQAGIPVPTPLPTPELSLYRLLSEQCGDAAHARYNALIRRLVSFERALSAAGLRRA